jgi:hypothetical protein
MLDGKLPYRRIPGLSKKVQTSSPNATIVRGHTEHYLVGTEQQTRIRPEQYREYMLSQQCLTMSLLHHATR